MLDVVLDTCECSVCQYRMKACNKWIRFLSVLGDAYRERTAMKKPSITDDRESIYGMVRV